jgi:hypothetical protein
MQDGLNVREFSSLDSAVGLSLRMKQLENSRWDFHERNAEPEEKEWKNLNNNFILYIDRK